MAEIKKRITQLEPGIGSAWTEPEVSAVVQGGVTKKIAESTKYGIGWWDKLKAGFVDFIAPEALHANDADTIGGETSAELHNAGALTGAAGLSVIPAANLNGEKKKRQRRHLRRCNRFDSIGRMSTTRTSANSYGSTLPTANTIE